MDELVRATVALFITLNEPTLFFSLGMGVTMEKRPRRRLTLVCGHSPSKEVIRSRNFAIVVS